MTVMLDNDELMNVMDRGYIRMHVIDNSKITIRYGYWLDDNANAKNPIIVFDYKNHTTKFNNVYNDEIKKGSLLGYLYHIYQLYSFAMKDEYYDIFEELANKINEERQAYTKVVEAHC